MKNVTIKLDDETAAWIRVHAASQGRSVSRIVADMLAEKMHASDRYESARRRWLARTEPDLTWPGGRLPAREKAYERRKFR
jgi:plasmid stability protein